MADVTKEIVLKVSANDATGPALESLEDKLNAAKKRMLELAAAGQQNSEEFIRLQQEAGEFKRTIDEVEESINDLASNGSSALTLMVEASQAVAAGFAIAQGAIALFGDENEDLQKAMLKVQGAIALVNGVQQINNLLTQNSVLITQASAIAQRIYAFAVGTSTGAMRAFRLALLATGIGAFVVVLGFAAEAMGLFGTSTKNTTTDLEAQKRAIDDNKAAADAYTRLLKAQGMSEKDLNNRRIKEIDILLAKTVSAQKQLNASAKAGLDFLQFEGETYNQVTFKAFVDNLNAQKLELQKQNKDIDKQKTDKATQTANELLAIQKKYQDQLALLNADGLRRELLAIDQKYEADLAKLKKHGKDTADLEAVIAKEKLQKEKEFGIQLRNVQQERDDKQKEAVDKQEQDDIARMQREGARRKKKVEAEIAMAEEIKRIEKAVADFKKEVTNDSITAIGQILSAFGNENKGLALAGLAIEKGAAIANVIINLQQEMSANAKMAAANPLNIATGGATYLVQTKALNTLAKVRAGLRIAAITAAGIQAGKSIMGGGDSVGGGGGGGMMPTGTGGGATPAATFTNPQTTNLGTGELSGGQGQGMQPMRAYVVERDIQQTTSRVRRLSEFATLG